MLAHIHTIVWTFQNAQDRKKAYTLLEGEEVEGGMWEQITQRIREQNGFRLSNGNARS